MITYIVYIQHAVSSCIKLWQACLWLTIYYTSPSPNNPLAVVWKYSRGFYIIKLLYLGRKLRQWNDPDVHHLLILVQIHCLLDLYKEHCKLHDSLKGTGNTGKWPRLSESTSYIVVYSCLAPGVIPDLTVSIWFVWMLYELRQIRLTFLDISIFRIEACMLIITDINQCMHWQYICQVSNFCLYWNKWMKNFWVEPLL